ncbi:MAG TPA: NADPH:quinone reductase [Actinomycetota bacterium]|nr:NADPH:quinone reductase [Actinomycetota bacterium]
MKSILYSEPGGPDVLRLVDRPVPVPKPGEVLVRMAVSGVNPTDWKSRRGGSLGGRGRGSEGVVPNQDGAGTIEAVGPGVDPSRIGERVWIWEAAWQRPEGTAQEFIAIPSAHAVSLPPGASLDLGASLGIPALTAHRCLTVGEAAPSRLAPGALAGTTVLVAGGAGAVGHVAIELARWAGATVITTVSSPDKARLAEAAGAHHVVNYREGDPAAAIRAAAPDGVDTIVEVAPATNAALDVAVVGPFGVVAVYASGDGDLVLPVRPLITLNARWQFVLVYTMPPEAKAAAVEAVSAALADGALRVGEAAGLPLHRFPLERTADAHAAVESRAVGKVLIDVGTAP